MYDIAIIGSGPAGLSAALNAKIRNKNFIIFGYKDLTNKLMKAPKVNNYLGFYDMKGSEIKERFENHIKEMGINITQERVNNIYAMGEYFAIMANENVYEAKTIILATGIEYTKPILGEKDYLGKGVGYCATCDAPLYKEKVVSIIGYNKEAEIEANYVIELAREVNYIPMYDGKYDLKDNINIIKEKPKRIIGKAKVEKLVLENIEIETDAVFLLKDSLSPEELVPGLELEDNHIKVTRFMETNIKGCFAAGDCVGVPYQYIKSAGEGNIASLSAVKYLDKLS
ncbi:NAD(P)/FAD-dependent oxidoreductase [Clostridium sp.]|uniref:NAD(P)/FAD-dependent oxidoreductase n=1 Tax=Clostridium sp. TaxID=1506 RepID=UPI00261C4F70|nr:NAD(P)/FAD-dependent oxidoreductase [Clostridium sp.]